MAQESVAQQGLSTFGKDLPHPLGHREGRQPAGLGLGDVPLPPEQGLRAGHRLDPAARAGHRPP
eukprot:4970838-Lingulodinium_polyedra.AAC.1